MTHTAALLSTTRPRRTYRCRAVMTVSCRDSHGTALGGSARALTAEARRQSLTGASRYSTRNSYSYMIGGRSLGSKFAGGHTSPSRSGASLSLIFFVPTFIASVRSTSALAAALDSIEINALP